MRFRKTGPIRVPKEISMSLSAIGPATAVPPQHESQKPAPAAASPQTSAASLAPDKVTLSAAAQKASQTGDIDHDGDSH